MLFFNEKSSSYQTNSVYPWTFLNETSPKPTTSPCPCIRDYFKSPDIMTSIPCACASDSGRASCNGALQRGQRNTLFVGRSLRKHSVQEHACPHGLNTTHTCLCKQNKQFPASGMISNSPVDSANTLSLSCNGRSAKRAHKFVLSGKSPRGP